ncbi:hypothetical protein GDO78_019724 [Eleutherodactylus coqui]|uniref:Uncharacterized protein n=1 Tax=Eleutherodactylus coqui TaxID=57060 RepID=A0A8J6BB10_ELECQ|nr:hypothetical protein GDO78_019724 [Eleutherodactylus coqui]
MYSEPFILYLSRYIFTIQQDRCSLVSPHPTAHVHSLQKHFPPLPLAICPTISPVYTHHSSFSDPDASGKPNNFPISLSLLLAHHSFQLFALNRVNSVSKMFLVKGVAPKVHEY